MNRQNIDGLPAAQLENKSTPGFESFTLDGHGHTGTMGGTQTYPAGVELLSQDGAPADVFHIEVGLVKLVRAESDGHEIILGLRSKGWLLGAAAVILDQPYAVSAITLTRSQVHRIRADEFRKLVSTNARFGWHVHVMHSREIYGDLAHVASLRCHSARCRLEHFLWSLVPSLDRTESDDEIRIDLPLRHTEIAQLISVTPQYLCELFHRLEEDGIVRRERDYMALMSRRKL